LVHLLNEDVVYKIVKIFNLKNSFCCKAACIRIIFRRAVGVNYLFNKPANFEQNVNTFLLKKFPLVKRKGMRCALMPFWMLSLFSGTAVQQFNVLNLLDHHHALAFAKTSGIETVKINA
jgi:hypothetical protein